MLRLVLTLRRSLRQKPSTLRELTGHLPSGRRLRHLLWHSPTVAMSSMEATTRSIGKKALVSSLVPLILTIPVLAARLAVRWKRHGLGPDDLTMFVAWVNAKSIHQ